MIRSVMKFEKYVKYFEAWVTPETKPLFVNESTICNMPPAFDPNISLMSTSEWFALAIDLMSYINEVKTNEIREQERKDTTYSDWLSEGIVFELV